MNKLKTETEDFSRYEFKYLLNAAQRDAIEKEILNFMTYDGHVHPEFGNSYIVRSLYFDNESAVFYHEKIDGIKSRKKYRLRTYGHEYCPNTPVFFEQKGRHIDRTFKHRISIDESELKCFLDPSDRFALLEHFPDTALVDEFIFSAYRTNLKPVVLVDYVRRPYVSQYDVNFRVTFDSEIKAAATDSIFPTESVNWRECMAGYTVLEVKFFRRVPKWFHQIIQAHEMRRISISKFCKGMEVCELAVDLS